MTKSRILFFALSAALVLTVVGGSLLAAVAQDDDEQDSLYKYLSVFTEVLGLARRAYVEEVDVETLIAGALDGSTEALDPFSLYLPAAQVEPYLAARERGNRLSGLTLLKDRGIAFAASVQPGSPAEAAGVRTSDIVTQIDGRSTRLMPVWEIQELLAQDSGTPVRLDLLRRGERMEATLVLGRFAPPPAGLNRAGSYGMVQVGALDAESVGAVKSALEAASRRGAEKLLLDLRGVSTGDADAAYRIAGLFTSGELGRLERRGETLDTFSSDAPPAWQGSLVVLIDRGTMGAAEILARVLTDKLSARTVGERTFGYAGRQDLTELPSGGRLVYTAAFYTGPDGEPIVEGLEPDVTISERDRILEEDDVPMRELILRRGIEELANPTPEAEEMAA